MKAKERVSLHKGRVLFLQEHRWKSAFWKGGISLSRSGGSIFKVGGKQILSTVPGLPVHQRCPSSWFTKLHDIIFRKIRATRHVTDWGSNSSRGELPAALVGEAPGWVHMEMDPLSAFGLSPWCLPSPSRGGFWLFSHCWWWNRASGLYLDCMGATSKGGATQWPCLLYAMGFGGSLVFCRHCFWLMLSLCRQQHCQSCYGVCMLSGANSHEGVSGCGFTFGASSWPILCQGHVSASLSCSAGRMYLLEELPVSLAWVDCLQVLGNSRFTLGLLLLWSGSISSSIVSMTSHSDKRRNKCDGISSASLVWIWLVYKLRKKYTRLKQDISLREAAWFTCMGYCLFHQVKTRMSKWINSLLLFHYNGHTNNWDEEPL